MSSREVALTTVDNPFDPFDEFDDWYRFDVENGYNSCSYLDRVSHLNNQMSSEEEKRELERAIDEITNVNFLGVWIKVVKENKK